MNRLEVFLIFCISVLIVVLFIVYKVYYSKCLEESFTNKAEEIIKETLQTENFKNENVGILSSISSLFSQNDQKVNKKKTNDNNNKINNNNNNNNNNNTDDVIYVHKSATTSSGLHEVNQRMTPLKMDIDTAKQKVKDIQKFNKSVLKQFRIFCINLKNTTIGKKRWNKLKSTIFGPYMERFPGIYGKTYDYSNEIQQNIIQKQWDFGKWKGKPSSMINMSHGEIGVSLSHYYLWKKIAEENIENAIILEDDSSDISKTFEKDLNDIMQHVPKDYDIILLAFWLHQGNDSQRVNDRISRTFTFVFMNAYVITANGARKLLAKTPIDMPIDSWVASKSHDLKIYRHHIQTSSLKPRGTLIQQGAKEEFGSYIDHTNNW